jgi:transcriptional regulator with XRE-family HTH domain
VQLRVAAGLLQEQVAERARLTRTKYSALERGEIASLSTRDAAALADALGTTGEEIRSAHAVGRAAHLARRTHP